MTKLKLVIKALMAKALSKILVDDLYMAYHGEDFYFILCDLDQYLRDQQKYNPNKLSNGKIAGLQLARNKIYDLMDNYEVDFNHVE